MSETTMCQDRNEVSDHGTETQYPTLSELKHHVAVHGLMQGLSRRRLLAVLERITRVDGRAAGSWVREWTEEAEYFKRRGALIQAVSCFNLARFPCVDTLEKAEALGSSIKTFQRWTERHPFIRRLHLDVHGQQLSVWGSNLSAPGPVVIGMGGIVSVKEQWHGILRSSRVFGFPVVLVDFPGTGESPLRYHSRSHEDVRVLLDALVAQGMPSGFVALASSFSGPIFLRLGCMDQRVQGILMAGSPIHQFFSPTRWRTLPSVTKLALAQCMRLQLRDARDSFSSLAIQPSELDAIQAPVIYISAMRDEIIPREDCELIRMHVPRARIVEIDDVHGIPNHLAQSALEISMNLLELTGRRTTAPGRVVGWMHALSHLMRGAKRQPS